MSLAKRINAQIKELSAIQVGKVNMDAPMWRSALKTIAKLRALQRAKDCLNLQIVMSQQYEAESDKLESRKPKKRGRK